jgi:hypothetical protein
MSRWLAGLLMVVACEGSGATGNGSTDGGQHDAPMGTSSDGVSIAASNVQQVGEVDGVPPGSGHILVVIDIALTNSGTKAASLAPALFSLETSAGVAFTASPLTSEETGACDASASVEPNAHATCTAVFEVDSSSLSKLIYTLPDNTTATVSVSLPGTGSGGGDGGFGDVCDASHACMTGYDCLGSGSAQATCWLPCTGADDPSCNNAEAGAMCLASIGSASYCVASCGSGAACPGVLTCYDNAFCVPPGSM